jgi:hypothetical protein
MADQKEKITPEAEEVKEAPAEVKEEVKEAVPAEEKKPEAKAKKGAGKTPIIIAAAGVLVTVIAVVGSWAVYFHVNNLQSTFVAEYEATVNDVYYRGEGIAYFLNPDGEARAADLQDRRLVVTDDSYVKIGDTIRVREYKGLVK